MSRVDKHKRIDNLFGIRISRKRKRTMGFECSRRHDVRVIITLFLRRKMKKKREKKTHCDEKPYSANKSVRKITREISNEKIAGIESMWKYGAEDAR